jgi:hypothetical protein
MKFWVCSVACALFASLGALASGCGGDVTDTSGGQGGSGPSGSSSPSGSSVSGTTGGGGSSDSMCGGIAGLQCGPTEYCDYDNNRCGAVDDLGKCKARPEGCPKSYFPTCGCDGMVYGNDCDAASKGADVSDLGGCMPPDASQFSCGHGFCAKGQQYCERAGSDVDGNPDSFTCRAYPGSCMPPADCACLANEPCGAMCEALPDGELMLTCLGG